LANRFGLLFYISYILATLRSRASKYSFPFDYAQGNFIFSGERSHPVSSTIFAGDPKKCEAGKQEEGIFWGRNKTNAQAEEAAAVHEGVFVSESIVL